MERWLRTDPEREAVATLEMLERELPAVATDLYGWRSVLLALHASVQAFMVRGLKTIDRCHVLSKKSQKQWLAWLDNPQTTPPDPWLAPFLVLYRRLKSERVFRNSHSEPFRPQTDQDGSLTTLNAYRNLFTHFLYDGASIEVGGLPQVLLDSLAVMRYVSIDSGLVRWCDESLEHRAASSLARTQEAAERLRESYDAGRFPDASGGPVDEDLERVRERLMRLGEM